MGTEKDYYHAKEVYTAICESLDEIGWKYTRDDEKLLVSFSVSGDDIPMSFIIVTDVERQIIRLLSFMPFTVPEDKRIELAVAACVANYKFAVGSFDLDIENGNLLFRVASSFRSSLISTELIRYLVSIACNTIDEYNDQFFAICKGDMTLQEYIDKNA